MGGLDVLIPLSVESYNRYLDAHSAEAASPLARFKLPVPRSAASASDGKPPSHLLLLVGNSKALWTPFLDFVESEMRLQDGRVLADPIDRYVKQTVHDSLQELSSSCDALGQAKVREGGWSWVDV
ncbi:hypothetical protein BBJ28_00009085 [Nothophytophthora sp. Chile5]|nr:hypothetical protein BBJ28_00009085 [Nothophytophthora sp. Chile5]